MTAGQDTARPLFLPFPDRGLFAIHHVPHGPVRGAVVFVPPFTEEMNKSRRMAALQARALASAGWHVLRPDLHGTGDSLGDFGDATWAAWLEDVARCRTWLAAEAGMAPWLWGLRAGALLAAQSAMDDVPPGLLLWQPVVQGQQHLQQFLRLLAGADWLAGASSESGPGKPMERLRAGEPVEVAGYRLAPLLALPMAQAVLRLPEALPRVVWLEVAPRADAGLSPAAQRALGTRQGQGVVASAVTGPSFWQSTEIEEAPALIAATLEAML